MARQPVISLFSGVGAFELGLSKRTRTIVYVEKDDFCQQVLQARMHDGLLDAAAIASDVVTYKPSSEMRTASRRASPARASRRRATNSAWMTTERL